jgi:hypothetical protein
MKRSPSQPVILTLRTFESCATRPRPRILPFPDRTARDAEPPVASERVPRDQGLSEVRDRLFRMIVANQWDRSHGNRAS